jgi:Heterokaryon incompatibility protein (HET)
MAGICDGCRSLILDILTGSTHANIRWHTITSRYATLSYTTHLNGTDETLRESAANGCPLCGFILDKLRSYDNLHSKPGYHVFVWGKVPVKCQFQVAVGDVETFTKHISMRQLPPSVSLFAQIVPESGLRRLTAAKSAVKSTRPTLPVLPYRNPASAEAFKQAQKWLAECRNNHWECYSPQGSLPKRVLDLGDPEKELRISLYITEREVLPYAALSYSWGETDKTTSKRIDGYDPLTAGPGDYPYEILQRKPLFRNAEGKMCFDRGTPQPPDNIPLEAFPKTQRDAIQVARALGFQYLWIDSLCILQGDTHDWIQQGAAMTEIYGGATLIISATSAECSVDGILNEMKNDKVPIGTWPGSDADDEVMEVFADSQMNTLDLEEKFLSTRGWVFQERLVSTATLHYTDEGMVWECVRGTQLSHGQNASCASWKGAWRDLLKQATLSSSGAAKLRMLGKTPNEIWYDWISAYSERLLFDVEDKFIAIAGVAKTFGRVFNLTYVAGLWLEHFVSGLLWRRHNRTRTLVRFPNKYIAPSWSWASVEGRLEYRNTKLVDSPTKGPNLKVLNYSVFEETILKDNERSYSKLQPGATITVQGMVHKITLDLDYHPGVRQKPFQECGVSKGFMNKENVLCTLDEYSDQAPRHYSCCCLRVGSHDLNGREGDVFLLHRLEANGRYRRVGLAETDAWWDRNTPSKNSGVFESTGQLTTLTIE